MRWRVRGAIRRQGGELGEREDEMHRRFEAYAPAKPPTLACDNARAARLSSDAFAARNFPPGTAMIKHPVVSKLKDLSRRDLHAAVGVQRTGDGAVGGEA